MSRDQRGYQPTVSADDLEPPSRNSSPTAAQATGTAPAVWLVVNPDRGGVFGCYLDEHEHHAHNAARAIGGVVARCPIVADYRTSEETP